MMNIETKFGPRDKVYCVRESVKSIVVGECEICKGTGKLALNDGRVLQCQECMGKGDKKECIRWRKPNDWTSEVMEVIAKSRTYAESNEIRYSFVDNGRDELILEEMVFGTYEEAEEYCDRWNEKSKNEMLERIKSVEPF